MPRPLIVLCAVLAWLMLGFVLEDDKQAVTAREHPPAPIQAESVPGYGAREHPLPLPSTKTRLEYEKLLFPWILSRAYDKELSWAVDKGVRDTGPYIRGQYYGTHPAVRIWYSPKMMYWLTGDPGFWPEGNARRKKPREGKVPDGAMMVKEMFAPPAARYVGQSDDALAATLFTPSSPGWTVMIKESGGAPDGWYWASVWKDQHYDTPTSLHYPEAGFGMACVRCHAVAEEGGTFAAMRNIKGLPGDPIAFFVDDTWRDVAPQLQPFGFKHKPAMPELTAPGEPGPSAPNPEFLYTFNQMNKVCYEAVQKLASEANDHVTVDPKNVQKHVTSDQCMMCHSGMNSKYAFGPIMFLETKRGGLNVSPYGEWRWSPMGLAGRDPVFHAQLESEVDQLTRDLGTEKGKFYSDQLVNTCLRCHGAMGKRQHDHDQGVGEEYWSPKANFQHEWYHITDEKDPHFKYGALARDGISCAICHRMVEKNKDFNTFLANEITGQFTLGPANELYGPFEDEHIVAKPMEQALAMKPKYSPFISKSRLCASCHIINLPVVDAPLDNLPKDIFHEPMPKEEIDQLLASVKNPHFKGFLHRIEQATYLEWVNSKFQDEWTPGKDARSCQDCHMPDHYRSPDGSVKIHPIRTKIATIEDQDYPEADHRIALKDMTVTIKEKGYRRHTFQGLNVFLAEVFNQFHDVLGVRRYDFETGVSGIPFAIENYVQNARENTARIEVSPPKVEGRTLDVDVKVTNLTGHRLPSGVGFRRVWIELLVIDDSNGPERVIWGSGRTNGVGVIVDGDGRILPSEFFNDYVKDGKPSQHYQKHHQVITNEGQVQIYEELAHDTKHRFTTSFIHRAHHVKDNRLLPAGWSRDGPEGYKLPAAFLKATWPGHDTDGDPQYADGSGTDVVKYRIMLPDCYDCKKLRIRATLYSQAWAPYYLKDRFTNVPAGPTGEARRRLYYLTSHLKTDGTAIEDWKLELVTDEVKVSEPKKGASSDGKGCG